MDSFILLAYASVAASRTLLQWLLTINRFILLVKTRKVISMNYGSSRSSWKAWRWVKLDLIFCMRDRFINSNLNPLTKLNSSSRSTEFKDIPPWKISEIVTKTIPMSTKIVISSAMKQGIPLRIWSKVNGNWANNLITISQWRESLCRTNTSVRRKKSKRACLWESQSAIQVEKLTTE